MSSQKRTYELKRRAEAQRRTRERIAAAAAELHEEVGVSKTTVADIARRAGVQRLTVYNHFPDLAALLPACSAHFLELHPQPDLGAAFALEDPRERLRQVLADLYRWYREAEPMQLHVLGERSVVPELDEFVRGTLDGAMAGLASALAKGLEGRPERVRTMVALALDFWTWHRLKAEGVDDDTAAELMIEAVAAVA